MPDPIETTDDSHSRETSQENPAVLDKTEARQGSSRMLNLRVMVYSLAALAVLFGFWYLYYLAKPA